MSEPAFACQKNVMRKLAKLSLLLVVFSFCSNNKAQAHKVLQQWLYYSLKGDVAKQRELTHPYDIERLEHFSVFANQDIDLRKLKFTFLSDVTFSSDEYSFIVEAEYKNQKIVLNFLVKKVQQTFLVKLPR